MGGNSHELAGRIDGTRLRAANDFEAALDGAHLHIDQPGVLPAALQGAEFERCAG